jgi:hypothetical protein
MEGNLNYQEVKHYKDGDARDKNGRWAGKVVTVRKEYYALIEEWQKKTGMKKAQFWREAVMRGALELARSYGMEASYPPIEDVLLSKDKPKRSLPSWLFQKRKPSNG